MAFKTQTVGADIRVVGYTYSNGDLASVTTPSGQLVTYGYSDGRIDSIAVNGTPLLSNVQYEPFGAVKGWTWGNGSTSTYVHDSDGNITEIDTGGEVWNYAHDDAFRITGITNTPSTQFSWTYGYDALDRLTSANKNGGFSESWTYDANGNRLTQGGTYASQWTVSPASNRVTAASGAIAYGGATPLSYDSAGNVTGSLAAM